VSTELAIQLQPGPRNVRTEQHSGQRLLLS
jgi:hypothetical protein